MDLTPRRIGPDDPALADILALIQTAFAGMEGRIDPPSSMHRLTVQRLSDQANSGEIWCIGAPPVACVVLTPKPDCLYIGKLSVAPEKRGQGLAQQLVALSETRAVILGKPCLELEVRVELIDNHRFFEKLGFLETGRTAHPGYDRPTSLTFRKSLA